MMVHFILPGETLQKIADEIGLENPVYIKEFHNQHCSREDYIHENLIPGKKILLPDFLTVQKFNAKNDAPFKSPERNPKLHFQPENLNKKYKIKVTETENDNGKITKSEFSYSAFLKFISTEFNEHIFHFTKDEFSNLHESKVEDLVIGCIKSINPIEIRLNDQGEILRLNITKEIQNQLHEIKDQLLDLFPDQYAEIYINEFEFAVSNPEFFNKKMKQDWFIKTYFAPFRKEFKNGKSYFDFLPDNKNLSIKIEQIAEISDQDDEIILVQTLFSKDEPNSDFTGKYTVDKHSGIIKNAAVQYRYSEYDVNYTTEFIIDELL